MRKFAYMRRNFEEYTVTTLKVCLRANVSTVLIVYVHIEKFCTRPTGEQA